MGIVKNLHIFSAGVWVLAGVAQAAMLASPPVAQETTAGDAGSGGSLAEIVVTAQKREQRLQDVPITIAALNAEMAQAMGVDDTTSLSQAVPGLNMYPVNVAITPYIRGIGNRNTAPGDEAATATYVDGVYIADMSAGVFALNNIDRIEVLKGPQGTLFGRNATAGVIQIITKTPQQTPSAEASIGYGNYDTVEANFYGTTGITSDLAADLAVHEKNQGEGWGRNLHTGQEAFLGHELSARTKWLLTPDSDTEITLALDYDRTIPVVPPAYADYLGHPFRMGITFPGFYNLDSTIDPRGDDRQYGASLQIHHTMNWARIVSISSYRNVTSFYDFDTDAIPAILQQAAFYQPERTLTQEVQLLSPANVPVQWIAGVFYFKDDAGYDPSILQLGPAAIVTNDEQISQSYAGFGQATSPLGADTNLTLGFRYTQDRRHVTGTQTVNGGAPLYHADQSIDFEKPTWRFALDHHFSQDVLGYLQYSRGFKSGLYNLVSPASPAVRPETVDSYEVGEKAEFLERRVRLNSALFYNKINDLQLQVPVVGGTQLLNAAQAETKGIDLDVQALPIDHLSISGGLEYLNTRYTDFADAAVFTPQPAGGNLQTVGDETGKQLIDSPPWTFNLSVQYQVPTALGKFAFNVADYYSTGSYFDQQNRVRQTPYNLVNASIDWTAAAEAWGIRLWGKNLADREYYSNVTPQVYGDLATPAAPRTFGFTLHASW